MRIKELRELKGMQQKELALELDIPSNTLSQYENERREPNLDILKQLANYFGVTTDYLIEKTDSIFCSDCGMIYNPLNQTSNERHQNYHSLWQDAVKEYGFCWNQIKSDEIELMSRRVLRSADLDTETAMTYAMDMLKAQFSDELREHGFEYSHDFNYFVAKQLRKHSFKDILPEEVYDELTRQYGEIELESIDNITQFTAKDNRDIKNDLDSIMEKLSNKEYGPAAFGGDEIPEDDLELFEGQLELMLRRLKAINKEKYNPYKNKE